MPADDDNAAGEDGAEVATEDLDLFPFDGDKIDLEPLFREQFVLAIPYAPLCREDCKGLCRPVRDRPEFRHLRVRKADRPAPRRTQRLEITLVIGH